MDDINRDLEAIKREAESLPESIRALYRLAQVTALLVLSADGAEPVYSGSIGERTLSLGISGTGSGGGGSEPATLVFGGWPLCDYHARGQEGGEPYTGDEPCHTCIHPECAPFLCRRGQTVCECDAPTYTVS